MTSYEQLKQVIQQANPEIMELKFGCEVKVLFDDSDFYGKVKPEWYTLKISHVSPKKAVITVVDAPFPNTKINVQEELDKGELEILGRPIRLADVLVAIEKKFRGEQFGTVASNGWMHFGQNRTFWNLKDDNLDNQSEETKQFLTDLLVSKSVNI